MAKEVHKNCNEHGEEFNRAFKKSIEEEMASTNRAGKRKRNCIETYNDLNEEELIIKEEEHHDDEEKIKKNVFMV